MIFLVFTDRSYLLQILFPPFSFREGGRSVVRKRKKDQKLYWKMNFPNKSWNRLTRSRRINVHVQCFLFFFPERGLSVFFHRWVCCVFHVCLRHTARWKREKRGDTYIMRCGRLSIRISGLFIYYFQGEPGRLPSCPMRS